jgi:hypothetical protein
VQNALQHVRRFLLFVNELLLLYFAWFNGLYFLGVAFFFMPTASCVLLATTTALSAQALVLWSALSSRWVWRSAAPQHLRRGWSVWLVWLGCVLWALSSLFFSSSSASISASATESSWSEWWLTRLALWCGVVVFMPLSVMGLLIKINAALSTVFSSSRSHPHFLSIILSIHRLTLTLCVSCL